MYRCSDSAMIWSCTSLCNSFVSLGEVTLVWVYLHSAASLLLLAKHNHMYKGILLRESTLCNNFIKKGEIIFEGGPIYEITVATPFETEYT